MHFSEYQRELWLNELSYWDDFITFSVGFLNGLLSALKSGSSLWQGSGILVTHQHTHTTVRGILGWTVLLTLWKSQKKLKQNRRKRRRQCDQTKVKSCHILSYFSGLQTQLPAHHPESKGQAAPEKRSQTINWRAADLCFSVLFDCGWSFKLSIRKQFQHWSQQSLG